MKENQLWMFPVELTQSSKVVEVIQRGDLLRSLRSLRELQPWSAPPLLAHLHRSAAVFLCSVASMLMSRL